MYSANNGRCFSSEISQKGCVLRAYTLAQLFSLDQHREPLNLAGCCARQRGLEIGWEMHFLFWSFFSQPFPNYILYPYKFIRPLGWHFGCENSVGSCGQVCNSVDGELARYHM